MYGLVVHAFGMPGRCDAWPWRHFMKSAGDVFGVADDKDLFPRFEAVGDARPVITEQAGAGARNFKHPGWR